MKISSYQYRINGWIFDFKYMYAQDDRDWSEYRGARKDILWNGNEILIRNDKGGFRIMFVEPEERFNLVINETYKGYIFEREILGE